MKVIGLTGGIATGKSSVCKCLQLKEIKIIDLDKIARDVVKSGSIGLEKIVKTFGVEYLDIDGELNRQKMGTLIFSDQSAKERLESITHPLILEKMLSLIKDYRNCGERIVVVEIPLLFEVSWQKYFDEIWLVYTDRETQIARLMERNKCTREMAIKQINSQIDIEIKKDKSDIILDNSSDINKLYTQIDDLIRRYSR